MLSTYDHKHSLLKIEYLSDALSELLYHCWQKKKILYTQKTGSTNSNVYIFFQSLL